MSTLLKISEVATMLRVSAKHVRRLVNSGEIVIVRMGEDSRADRIEQKELDRFINRRRTNRSLLGEPCQSTNVAIFTGSNSSTTAARLDALLGRKAKEKRKPMSASSERKPRQTPKPLNLASRSNGHSGKP